MFERSRRWWSDTPDDTRLVVAFLTAAVLIAAVCAVTVSLALAPDPSPRPTTRHTTPPTVTWTQQQLPPTGPVVLLGEWCAVTDARASTYDGRPVVCRAHASARAARWELTAPDRAGARD